MEAFWRQLYTLKNVYRFCSTTSGVFRSTSEVVPEHLSAHRFAFSLSGSIWEHLEASVLLFRVAELFGYDFETILHFGDGSRLLEMQQGCLNLHATLMESRTQTKRMTVIGYISDTEDIIKPSWSDLEHDGAAAFELAERSPLPLAVYAKDHTGGESHVLDICWIKKFHCHPAEMNEASISEHIPKATHWHNWDGNSDNQNEREDEWEADSESNTELDNGIENRECPGKRDVSAARNVPGSIQPLRRSTQIPGKWLMTVNVQETRRFTGNKKM